jgi:hypothetical protein
MRRRSRLPHENHVLRLIRRQRDFTTAAIAAAPALLAQVIAAGVLGTCGADTRRFFLTDAAKKSHSSDHWVYGCDAAFFTLLAGAGSREIVARHLCAS